MQFNFSTNVIMAIIVLLLVAIVVSLIIIATISNDIYKLLLEPQEEILQKEEPIDDDPVDKYAHWLKGVELEGYMDYINYRGDKPNPYEEISDSVPGKEFNIKQWDIGWNAAADETIHKAQMERITEMGNEAQKKGLSLYSNPYFMTKDLDRYKAWRQGWINSKIHGA